VGLDDAGGEDGGLIAGHARVLAARQLGIAEIPVMVAAGWTEAQKRAYVLADNQLAITGSGWDPELLRLELGELKLGGFDLSLTGFGDLELKDLLTAAAFVGDEGDLPLAEPQFPHRNLTAFIVDKAPWLTVTEDLPQHPARIPGQNAPHHS
jgi:ParB-like chromosome segregation protein Spo0J